MSQSAGHGMPSGIVASIDLSACFIGEEEVLSLHACAPAMGFQDKGYAARDRRGRTVVI